MVPKTGLEVAGADAWLLLPLGASPLVPPLRSGHSMKEKYPSSETFPPLEL